MQKCCFLPMLLAVRARSRERILCRVSGLVFSSLPRPGQHCRYTRDSWPPYWPCWLFFLFFFSVVHTVIYIQLLFLLFPLFRTSFIPFFSVFLSNSLSFCVWPCVFAYVSMCLCMRLSVCVVCQFFGLSAIVSILVRDFVIPI